LSTLDQCLDLCDLVLVMSVAAGFGGQSFRPIAVEKLKHLRQTVRSDVLLEVDGGINSTTIHECAVAGAELFVVGSGIFRAPSYSEAIRELAKLAAPS
jgi:ribulose-phosphate 3-epimerase